ncbi:MAG: PAS-domain containing protein [Rhodospirillales bacterium]|nr:PAS-domain containing protein [Rhodospirillales bacterium]
MAIEAIPEGFAYYDADDRLVMFNRNYRRIYEDCSDLIVPGAHFPTILQLSVNRGQYGIPPDQREKWTKDRIEQHRNPPGPIEHQLSNGRWVRIEEKRTPDGGYVGFRTDITDFKRREIELQRQTTLLNATLQNMSEGISVIDKDLRLVAWNDKFLSIMRLPPHLVFYGAALRSIILFQATRGEFGSVDPEEEADRRINAREQMKKLVVERQRADGTTIELRRSPMPDGGIVTVYSDITERKRTESALMAARDAAEQATGIKSEFLATMSHEIRTPMNGVVGMTELLLETELGPIQRRYAEIIQKSAYSLLNIINAVLDFSKLEAGRFDLERAPFNLADSVTVVADLIAPQTRAKGISFESKIAPDVPLQLIGDAGRLRQLLLNLLNNAVKFTDSGSVRLEVIRLGRSEGKVRLHFTVSDTGIGIAPTMQSRLFNRFEQLDPSINRRFGGTGLGLAICKKLTELMGGEIGVESEIGQGSKFWFAVDLSERAATESAPQLVRRDAMLPERALHVLLVEDNAVNQLVAAAAIESLGHSIEIVATGGAAVDAVRARAFDLVFMDLQMPEMDGFQATRQIRDLPGERGQVPIIALTAYTRPDDRERCLAAGMNGYLVKPLQKSVLESILLEWSWRRDTKVDPAPVERLLSARRSSSPATSRSVIDRTVLTAIESDVGESAMAGLIAKFVADAHKHLTDLRAAAENSDSSAIQRHAHILAGTFRTFGLVGAAPIADEIENACRQKDTAQASSLAAALAAAAAPALSEIASLYTPADGKTATA